MSIDTALSIVFWVCIVGIAASWGLAVAILWLRYPAETQPVVADIDQTERLIRENWGGGYQPVGTVENPTAPVNQPQPVFKPNTVHVTLWAEATSK